MTETRIEYGVLDKDDRLIKTFVKAETVGVWRQLIDTSKWEPITVVKRNVHTTYGNWEMIR